MFIYLLQTKMTSNFILTFKYFRLTIMEANQYLRGARKYARNWFGKAGLQLPKKRFWLPYRLLSAHFRQKMKLSYWSRLIAFLWSPSNCGWAFVVELGRIDIEVPNYPRLRPFEPLQTMASCSEIFAARRSPSCLDAFIIKDRGHPVFLSR